VIGLDVRDRAHGTSSRATMAFGSRPSVPGFDGIFPLDEIARLGLSGAPAKPISQEV